MRKNRSTLVSQVSSTYLDAASRFSTIRRSGCRTVYAYVEGYDDIAFWRSILSNYESDKIRFEINVPNRDDLAKGKKVLLSMIPSLGDSLILCMDSDFDYLFDQDTPQSRLVNSSKYIFQTYTYSIENHLCYPPSLRRLAVQSTKNDKFIFDFEDFMVRYSETIYKLFLWYALSAYVQKQNFFPLVDFKNAVSIHFVDVPDKGNSTIEWLKRQCRRKEQSLREKYPEWVEKVRIFGELLEQRRGVVAQNVHYFMHGHTLYENVALVALEGVCEALKVMTIERIRSSSQRDVTLKNELSNYKNTLRSPSNVIQENDEFTASPLFKLLDERLREFVNNINNEK